MRRLLPFVGLAAAGAFVARKLRRRGDDDTADADTQSTSATEEREPPSAPADRTAEAPGATRPVERQDLPTDVDIVAREEAAAAAEAAAIGGPGPRGNGDPAMDPVYQAGGGEAEGFEAAEAELIENATHGDGRGKPWRDAFTGERESDLSGASYGEPDEVDVSEVVRDPDAGSDPSAEAGEGPGRAHDR